MREKLLLVVLQRRFNWLGYEPKNRCKVELELDDLLGTARAVQFLQSFTIQHGKNFRLSFHNTIIFTRDLPHYSVQNLFEQSKQ